MKKLMINGIKEIQGKEVRVIEGGFGEGQKCILAADIAMQHDIENTNDLNKLINKNIGRFNKNDLLDFLNDQQSFRDFAKDNGFITSNRVKNIYLLSERGYTKLVAMMDNANDKKWEVMDRLVDEYFTMRQVINSDEQKKKELAYQLMIGGIDSIEAYKRLLEIETKPLLETIEVQKPMVDLAIKRLDINGCISITDATETFGLTRGKITTWAKQEGYLHKTINEVNQQGKEYFKVYQQGKFRCIGISEVGIKHINDNIEAIKVVKKEKSKKSVKKSS